jgi:hypothetical protein
MDAQGPKTQQRKQLKLEADAYESLAQCEEQRLQSQSQGQEL